MMWDALIRKDPAPEPENAQTPARQTLAGSIRTYLREHPNVSSKQIAVDLGVTHEQAISSLYYMEKSGRVIAALDHSKSRKRLIKHYSIGD